MFHAVKEINHVESSFISQLCRGSGKERMQAAPSGPEKPLLGKSRECPRIRVWLGCEIPARSLGEVSSLHQAAGKALLPSLLKDVSLKLPFLWLGLPLLETDCLLLFLHLAGIISVFQRVICCPLATCNPSFLFCFLLFSAACSQSCFQGSVSNLRSQFTNTGNPVTRDFLL